MGNTTFTVGGLGAILFICVICFGLFSAIGSEIQEKNGVNLDNKSRNIISYLGNGTLNTYNNDTFVATSSSVPVNDTSFLNVDPFSRQYLEDKSTSNQNTGIIDTITGLPEFIYNLTGLDNVKIILTIIGILGTYILFIIGLAIYKFLKGEVD